jgi:hypothetical protein
MLRLARAFVAGRLVQHQAGEFGIRPVDAIDREDEISGRDVGKGIVANLAIDRDAFVANQPSAALARTEAVFLEESFKLHGRDANIGP